MSLIDWKSRLLRADAVTNGAECSVSHWGWKCEMMQLLPVLNGSSSTGRNLHASNSTLNWRLKGTYQIMWKWPDSPNPRVQPKPSSLQRTPMAQVKALQTPAASGLSVPRAKWPPAAQPKVTQTDSPGFSAWRSSQGRSKHEGWPQTFYTSLQGARLGVEVGVSANQSAYWTSSSCRRNPRRVRNRFSETTYNKRGITFLGTACGDAPQGSTWQNAKAGLSTTG